MTLRRWRLRPKGWAAVFVALITLLGASFVYATIVKFHDIPFPWDCGARACEGWRIAQDLKSADLVSFIGDTYRQGWWGFFHSWLLAPSFLLLGATYAAARLVSLVCFVLLIVLIYATALEFSKERGAAIGLMTVVLTWTSLPFLVYAAMSMAEIPGTFMTFLTLLFYLKAMKTQKAFFFVTTGILMALTLFTAWHHGVFVIFAVVLTQLTLQRKIFSRANRYLLLPFLVIIIGWFAYPGHITSFYGHSTFQPHYYRLMSLDNLIYYPRYFIGLYHGSWVIGAAMAIGFVFSLRKIRNPAVRLFAAQIALGLVMMTIKLDNRPRYIISLVPSIWLLGSSGLLDVADRLKRRFTRTRRGQALAFVALSGAAVLFIGSAVKLYHSYPDKLVRLNYTSSEKLVPVYEYLAEKAGALRRLAVFGSWDYAESPNSPTIRWQIEVRRSRDAGARQEMKKAVHRLFGAMLTEWTREAYRNFVGFLESKDVRVDEYHLLSFMKTLDSEAYDRYRKNSDLNPFSDKMIDPEALEPDVDGLITIRYGPEKDLNAFLDRYLAGQRKWTEVASRRFDALDLTVALYERSE
jgi:hypothetical protein